MDRMTLLNPWQRGFPLSARPWDPIAAAHGLTVPALLTALRSAQADGAQIGRAHV